MPSTKIGFRAGHLDDQLAARTPTGSHSYSTIAQRDLDRYYQLLAAELATVAQTLTTHQALALADATNGIILDIRTARMLHHELAAAMTDGIAEKWQIDADKLLDTVRQWTLPQRLAMLDAIERWWIWTPAEGQETDNEPEHGYSHAYRLAAVGLITAERAEKAID